MRKWLRCPAALLLFAFAGLFCLWDAAAPDRAFSDLENRYLAQPPDFSLRSFLDGSFCPDYEEYLDDQFVLRDSWISLKAASETALGKQENNGVVAGEDGYLFDKRLALDAEQLEKNTAALSAFLAGYEGDASVMIVPSSYQVLQDKVPAGLPNVDQAAGIASLYDSLDHAVLIDACAALEPHAEEEIYYRTDHHWTTLGAYYGYEAYCLARGLEPVALESLTPHEVPDFYGTYYSRAKLRSARSDTIVYYDVPVLSMEADLESYPGLYWESQWQRRDKYAAFLYGNHGLTVIRSAREAQGEPKRLLVFKDSFANCLAPFLTANYDEITVIDLRYFQMSVQDYLDAHSFDDVLILYNYLNFADDTALYRLNR